MKNILSGKLKLKKATCPYCDCEFTFNITDIDNGLFHSTLYCPICNGKIKSYSGSGMQRELFDSFEDYVER